ncbi:MAG TPA: ATP-binding SpoIIE family protein phosphatase [Noviherbaspirillum sp.]|nr:ATP-binding SpoIIE family protein phosphatase [Noviherbaspirillum sp.]
MEAVLSFERPQQIVKVSESSGISAARRSASDIARAVGLNETRIGEVALLVTEAATNIVKHARDGEILIRPLMDRGNAGVELIALDSGPGMANLPRSMQDGVSTSGTYGIGLGAMQRNASDFDIYTAPGKGTAIFMTVRAGTDSGHTASIQAGAVCQPIGGETRNGDAWCIVIHPTSALLMMADGLGHGDEAADASDTAAQFVKRYPGLAPTECLERIHGVLRSTRGAAVAVAYVDTMAEKVRFSGVGNISATILANDKRHQLVSHNGIVGSNVRKLQEFQGEWSDTALLIMHSDGLGGRWDLSQYPGLSNCHPAVVAAVLYRDFRRGRDDVSVVVVRGYRSL